MQQLEEFELELVSGGVESITAVAGNGSDAQRQRERERQAAQERARQAERERNRGEFNMSVERGPDGGVSMRAGVTIRF